MRHRSIVALVVPILVCGSTAAYAAEDPAEAASGFATSPRHAAPTSTGQTVIAAVRVSKHAEFDRITFTFRGPQPGYDVAYRSRVTTDLTNRPVPLRGSAFLKVVLRPTSTMVKAPQGTITPKGSRIKQVKGAGDFEALTSYGVGVAGRLPFRVMRLSHPNRLVVDVASARSAATLPHTGDSSMLPLAFTALTLVFTGLALRVGGHRQPTGSTVGVAGGLRMPGAPRAPGLVLARGGTGRRRRAQPVRPTPPVPLHRSLQRPPTGGRHGARPAARRRPGVYGLLDLLERMTRLSVVETPRAPGRPAD